MTPRIKSMIWNIRKQKKKKSEHQEEKIIHKNTDRLRSLSGSFKHTNIWIIGVPEGENTEQDVENLFEKIMKENFPNLVKEIDIQVQGAQRVPNKMDVKRPTPSHFIVKIPKIKDKERILKAATKIQDLQPTLLYPAKPSFSIKGQINRCPDKKKLKEFIITKPLL